MKEHSPNAAAGRANARVEAAESPPGAATSTVDLGIHDRVYIDGSWVAPHDAGVLIDVIDSATEQVMGRVASAGPRDVDRAVAAARAAAPEWSRASPAERAGFLRRVADGLETRTDVLAETIAREVGTAKHIAVNVQVGFPISLLRIAADLVESLAFEEQVGTSVVIKEAVGVVACITPWNFPLTQVVSKVASALAAGCTLIVKPSREAPLSVCALAEVVEAAGLPAGVFNLLNGSGPVIGAALATHPEVDMISFTGSTEIGRHIAALAARGVKRTTLELGGKSPTLILDDADARAAVEDGLARAFLNSGQTCSALTRMLVPRARLDEFERAAIEAVAQFRVGDPLDARTRIGPLVSATQRDSVRAHIAAGVESGAKLLTGGAAAPESFPVGYYVTPTIFSEVDSRMQIAREEIFGPVLAMLPYDDEAEAVRIANDTIYGLAAGVWSDSRERAEAVARRLVAGQVHINGGAFNPQAPFGGFKQSGYGRERGKFGIEEFLELKSLQF